MSPFSILRSDRREKPPFVIPRLPRSHRIFDAFVAPYKTVAACSAINTWLVASVIVNAFHRVYLICTAYFYWDLCPVVPFRPSMLRIVPVWEMTVNPSFFSHSILMLHPIDWQEQRYVRQRNRILYFAKVIIAFRITKPAKSMYYKVCVVHYGRFLVKDTVTIT